MKYGGKVINVCRLNDDNREIKSNRGQTMVFWKTLGRVAHGKSGRPRKPVEPESRNLFFT